MAISLKTVSLSLRIAQAILTILVLALGGYVAHWWVGFYHAKSPHEVNFLIFNAVWSILAIGYLVAVPWRFAETSMHHKYAMVAVEGVTMIFWFAGFVALAVFLSGRVCYGHVCSAVQAADVFAAFAWIAFAGTTTLSFVHTFPHHSEGTDQSEHKGKSNLRVHHRV